MQPQRHTRGGAPSGSGAGLARLLSKLGVCSRSQAWALIQAGRVRVDGVVIRDPERRTDWRRERVGVDERAVCAEAKVYLMLNKPRGLVTTVSDERGRGTVYQCLSGFGGASSEPSGSEHPLAQMPPLKAGSVTGGQGVSRLRESDLGQGGARPYGRRVFPVGRLDKASEGLLLFTNDTAWAARVTAPGNHVDKTYHVQVDCLADGGLLQRVRQGVTADGDRLAVKQASLLRHGEKNSWLEIVLDEGKNRHLRRLLAALGVNVLRLMRVAIGPLRLGTLAKGESRALSRAEVLALAKPSLPDAGR